MTSGLKQSGWDVVVGCDSDPAAGRSYVRNHPGTTFVSGDITLGTTVDAIHRATSGRRIDLVVICAPCQSFSSKNANRGDDDARQQLIVKALAVVERLSPALVLFENVTGLATKRFAPVLDALRVELMRLGYAFSGPTIHNASQFGVPQARRRCLMLAARELACIERFESHNFPRRRMSVREAIADLTPLNSGEQDPVDPMHRARLHRPIALERLRHIPRDGGSRSALPSHLVVDCHKRAGDAFPDSYGRLSWDQPAPTLTGGCTDVTKGRYAHPEQDRALTLREAARLQSFPDDYFFEGSGSEIAQQIGNAVPPRMVEAVGLALIAALAFVTPDRTCETLTKHHDVDWFFAIFRGPILGSRTSTDARRRPLSKSGAPPIDLLGPGSARPRDPPVPVFA